MATVIARYPRTASGRAAALGHLDRLGRGAESLVDTDHEIIALVQDYAGDEDQAAAHFAGAKVEHNSLSGKPPKAGESEDWEPVVELPGGEVISRPASSREPWAPPEVEATPPANVTDQHAPDSGDRPSPGLSGAAQGQARRDKQAAGLGDAEEAPADEPAPRASRASESKADSKAKK